MGKQPKISIIIPLYNVERFVGKCLDSILTQSFQDYEIIIVDDASTDNSLGIVKEYQRKDDRIKIIEKKTNEGSMMARKTGYQNANGEYYFFCDSDDYLPSTSLNSLYYHSAPDIDMIVGNVFVEYENGGTRIIKRSDFASCSKQYKEAILTGTICTLWGILYKSSLFKNSSYVTFKNQSFSEDRILLSQILENVVTMSSVDEIVYIYNVNNQSITNKKLNEDVLESQFRALKWCYEWNRKTSSLDFMNNKWLLRKLSSYLIEGYKIIPILKKVQLTEFYSFNNLSRYCGLLYAINIFLCKRFKVYQCLINRLRKIRNRIRFR